MTPSESVIFCEGYHDRAFWKGWLVHRLGCRDPKHPARGAEVRDPWNKSVSRGAYAFHSRGGEFIRVVPCNGKDNVRPSAAKRLGENRRLEPLARVVICVDGDFGFDLPQFLSAYLQPDEFELQDTQDALLDGGATRLSVVRWECDDQTVGLPRQQCLERLVCAALGCAYPERSQAVDSWLASAPVSSYLAFQPSYLPKSHAWSFMAGWYSEHGCEDFYTHLWRDKPVADQLEIRLRACGAWRIAEELANLSTTTAA